MSEIDKERLRRQKRKSIALAKDKNGGKIESDVEEFNRRFVIHDDNHISAQRRRLDSFNFDRNLERELREVWE